jgi:hypothetical protein
VDTLFINSNRSKKVVARYNTDATFEIGQTVEFGFDPLAQWEIVGLRREDETNFVSVKMTGVRELEK